MRYALAFDAVFIAGSNCLAGERQVKPLGRFRPEPPRRRDRASLGFLVTAAVAAIWLGLYGLLTAGMINQQMLLVIVLVTAPIAFFPVIVSGWGTGLGQPGSCSPEWPPIDIIVPWPLDDGREIRPRRARRTDLPSKDAHRATNRGRRRK